MEDVWVWDKNRPTRIIPRAEVYTSSDVTVEELRGENDDPKLTAEALAERLGERLDGRRASGDAPLGGRSRTSGRARAAALPGGRRARSPCSSPSTSATRRRCSACSRASGWSTASGSRPTAAAPATSSASRSARSSSSRTSTGSASRPPVPALQREWERVAERWAEAPLLTVGPGVKTGIPIRYDDPREVGPDRIVNAVAASERYGAPCIVVDFGTSTNFDIVSPEGGVRRRRARARGSRSRWTRSSPGRRGSSRSTSRRRRP